MTVTLKVAPRGGSADAVRAEKKIPAVVYGPKQEPINIEVDAMAFEKLMAEAGESTIITLEGLETPLEVLIQDVSFNAARGGAEHADFYAIERGKELTTNVGLEFVGEAPVEKGGATVNKVLHEVEVTCRPSNLPSHIEVDISVLTDTDSHISVADLVIPEGVTVNTDAEAMVATVAEARAEESEEAPEAVDMEAVEVEQKGKEEEGGTTEE